ncbi:MAG TPA: class I SAM-dependent methyltransferase [Mycobacterium sp.]|jgi:2-polyprenyl-3-methyl-5-hydroxy-6-metoxy-1,4-benzoquinol methylase|uniref:class I SAM-dependent methyltransferase n=1 Tax=Mycobacterium sp. TaxID=1785 RepID=UPI002D659EFF|nr:class I SAM-dependent methyltransferase [Mycobacterium sp.]HZU46075.1 class I SAM-dependent methyltransferase [Mycobacterium sp.]
MTEYWNHNTAYHTWILRRAASGRHHCLDVGCGDGLLLQRLAPVARTVTGIDVDQPALSRARHRVAQFANVAVEHTSFEHFDPGPARFGIITFVASIHHMDFPAALQKARSLLLPGGELLIVGLAANKSLTDWMVSALATPFAFAGSRWHRETRDIGLPVAQPQESLSEISAAARQVLPGVSIRRAMYYRYLLRWRNCSS